MHVSLRLIRNYIGLHYGNSLGELSRRHLHLILTCFIVLDRDVHFFSTMGAV